jgi:putative oxidoreductase
MLGLLDRGGKLSKWAHAGEPYFVFLVRASLGATFASAGYGKLTHLERTIGFFRDLGIPAPELQAPFIGGLELVGGVCIALGLLTRLVSPLLAGTMIVAMLTAILPDVEGALDLLTRDESLYLFLFAWLLTAGAGTVSLDHWLARRLPRLSWLARAQAAAPIATSPAQAG